MSSPLFVFATSNRFYSSFHDALGKRKTRFYPLSSHQGLNINRVLRSNLDAVAVVHISGPQSARFIDDVDEDTASRVVLVNSESGGALENPDRFKNTINIHFRHPDIGRMTAEYFFKNVPKRPVNQEFRAPSTAEQ